MQDKPGQGGNKGAYTSVSRLQRIATRAVNVQNVEFNTAATTSADRSGNNGFGAQGKGKDTSAGFNNNNNGRGRNRGKN